MTNLTIDVVGFVFAYIMIMYVFRKYFFGSPPSNRANNRNVDLDVKERTQNMSISHIVIGESEKKQIMDHISQKNSEAPRNSESKFGHSIKDEESKDKTE